MYWFTFTISYRISNDTKSQSQTHNLSNPKSYRSITQSQITIHFHLLSLLSACSKRYWIQQWCLLQKGVSLNIYILCHELFFLATTTYTLSNIFLFLLCSVNIKVRKDAIKTSIALFVGLVFGIFIGLSFPALPLTKVCNLV